jgi:DNA-binding NtrC family response regulator
MAAQYQSRAVSPESAPAIGAASVLRILVVDDEPGICQLLREALTRYGHHVAAFSRAEEAIAGAAEEDYAVVLLDVMMPGMDGQQTLASLRAHLPRATFVMMTGYPDSELAASCLDDGAMLCLPKPVRIANLLDLIASIVAERNPYASAG